MGAPKHYEKLKGFPSVRIVIAPLKRYQNHKERLKGETLYGMVRPKRAPRTIYLDPRAENIISTCYHELMHIRHPEWDEDQVEIAEHQWWENSTWKEKAEVLQWLAKAEIKNPKEVV
jgi:hypothetical protein